MSRMQPSDSGARRCATVRRTILERTDEAVHIPPEHDGLVAQVDSQRLFVRDFLAQCEGHHMALTFFVMDSGSSLDREIDR